MQFDQYVNKVFCLNLDRRTDRWEECLKEFERCGITQYERISGYVHTADTKQRNGHIGCTRSHRLLLRRIAESDWARVLVLEDDFQAIKALTFQADFAMLHDFVPLDFDILYIGGSYGTVPLARINAHVIKVDRVHTTSSYIITRDFAK